jgi:hypothetical protein
MSTIANKLHRNRRRAYIERYEFSPSLRSKLVEEFGSAHRADVALDGLRAWYLACLYADGELIGMPSKLVDVAWHQMILRTREYAGFCTRAFGQYLHHTPDSALDVPMSMILPHTLQMVEQHDLPMVLFTADQDARFEDGYEWSRVELRRMRDRYTGLAEQARVARRRRRAWSGGGAYSGGVYGGGDGGHHGGGGDGGGGCGGGGGGCGGGGS